jgi:hypothetical protein
MEHEPKDLNPTNVFVHVSGCMHATLIFSNESLY